VLDQPHHRPVEQRPRTLVGHPDPAGDERPQLQLDRVELADAQQVPNLPGVIPLGLLPIRVLIQAGCFHAAELLGNELSHHRRDLPRLGQERAEHPDRSPLHRPAQPVVATPLGPRELQRGLIQAEKLLKLLRSRIADEPTVARYLILRKILYRHAARS
jgi:hypothetical protein